MVMFVLHEDGTDFFNFNIDPQRFKLGEIIEHESIEGKHKVVNCDPVTVTVIPIK